MTGSSTADADQVVVDGQVVEVDELDDPTPMQPRDRYDRPLIVPPEGGDPVPYRRASTVAGALDDAGGLVKWRARNVARGLAQRPDLALLAAVYDYGSRDLDDVIDAAAGQAGGDDAANYGTALHHLFATGADPEAVPEQLRDDYRSLVDACARHGLRVVSSERFVVNDAFGIAGTYDAIVEVPGVGRVVADVKTGKYKPTAHVVQLAAYAGGVHYDQGVRTPLDVRTDLGLLLHVPRGKGATFVYVLDLRAGVDALHLAQRVLEHRARKGLGVSLDQFLRDGRPDVAELTARVEAVEQQPATRAVAAYVEAAPAAAQLVELPPADAVVDAHDLAEAIACAMTLDQLNALYDAHASLWEQRHTELAVARRNLIDVGLI